MKLVATIVLLFAVQQGRVTELIELRGRAKTIRERRSSDEITEAQARRRVQLLLQDFEAWATTHGVELELRTRTLTPASSPTPTESLSVDQCSLFYDDDTNDELCLIDLKRSEAWGVSILFCRYLCE